MDNRIDLQTQNNGLKFLNSKLQFTTIYAGLLVM